MRQTTLFNDDWKFQLAHDNGDADATLASDAATPDFDDASWRTLSLPHDWAIEQPFSEKWASATGFLPGGVGWYRKTFATPTADMPPDGRVYVHFDGVYCNSEVWLNGQSLGARPNGYIGFRYDLTPHLRTDGVENVLAVRVDHRQFGDSRWYTGSGIYRNVWLIVTGPVHVGLWGIAVTTPTVTTEHAEVQVRTVVDVHDGAPDADWSVEHVLWDATAGMAARGEGTNATLTVEYPTLWSVETPTLYELVTTIWRGDEAVDRVVTPVGIRSIHFDPNEGFTLNGENLKLKGVCLHDDAGALGVAVPPAVWERRLRILKECGANAIRMAHNPHLPELYDLCDQMGFLVQDEAFDEWERGKNKWIAGWNVGTPGQDGYHSAFFDWAERDLRDLIRRDHNHPSIIMWSIGNEIDYPNDPYTHEALDIGTNPQIYGRGFNPDLPHSDRLGEIARYLTAVAKSVDTTRPITAALSAALISTETGFGATLDVVGYNYQEYRYAEDHARFPDWTIYGSENGMQLRFWEAVANNPYICGQFLWTGIDYLGEAGKWPARSNTAGILDLACFAKPEYYFRKCLWTDEPTVWVGSRPVPKETEEKNLWSHVTVEPVWRGTPDEMVRVVAFTNCGEAELLVNGGSMGTRLRIGSDPMVFWDVPYEPGVVTVVGRVDGADATRSERQTHGPAARLIATLDKDELTADGIDLAHIEVTVVDAAGIPVYDAADEIVWTIEGPARLIGLENGDPTSHEDYKASHRRAFQGRLLGYVQSTVETGDISVSLEASGLEPARVRLTADR